MTATIDPGVDIGHVNLKVSDIDRALAFYVGVLGFEEQARIGDQAAFVHCPGEGPTTSSAALPSNGTTRHGSQPPSISTTSTFLRSGER